MAKKAKKHQTEQNTRQQADVSTVADMLGEDVIAQLKQTKKQLDAKEQEKEQQAKQQRIQERKEREKNKSFEELLEEYGDQGSKY